MAVPFEKYCACYREKKVPFFRDNFGSAVTFVDKETLSGPSKKNWPNENAFFPSTSKLVTFVLLGLISLVLPRAMSAPLLQYSIIMRHLQGASHFQHTFTVLFAIAITSAGCLGRKR